MEALQPKLRFPNFEGNWKTKNAFIKFLSNLYFNICVEQGGGGC